MEENSEEENLQSSCVMLRKRLTDLWVTDVPGLSALYLQPFGHRYFVGNPVQFKSEIIHC